MSESRLSLHRTRVVAAGRRRPGVRAAAPLRVPLRVAWWLVLLAASPLLLAACGPRPAVRCVFPDDLLYSAALDSIGLDTFSQLAVTQQATRRQQARGWLSQAKRSTRTDTEIRSLRNSVGLAPDQPEVWLELAELTRWTGDYQDALSYLRNAWESTPFAAADRRNELRNLIAHAYSWLHYDRGEWRKGLAWSDTSLVYGPEEQNTMQIRGLLMACSGKLRYAEDIAREIYRRDPFNPDIRWIRGMSDWGQKRYEEASQSFSGVRPTVRHRAECWQSTATLEEYLHHWDEARRRYERTRASLPLSAPTCLSRHEFQPLDQRGEVSLMPVWLAFDRFFVAGSMSAYTALAARRLERSSTSAEREFWAGATVDAASICIRKDLDKPWALVARGIVFAQIERFGLARQDLGRAVRMFEKRRHEPAEALAWLGHVHLKEESFPAALPFLRRAVAADNGSATAWSDLGLALIKTGDMSAAVDALDKAIALDDALAVAWYNRGLTHFHAKRWTAALGAREVAARLAPDNANVQQTLRRARIMADRAPVPASTDDE